MNRFRLILGRVPSQNSKYTSMNHKLDRQKIALDKTLPNESSNVTWAIINIDMKKNQKNISSLEVEFLSSGRKSCKNNLYPGQKKKTNFYLSPRANSV